MSSVRSVTSYLLQEHHIDVVRYDCVDNLICLVLNVGTSTNEALPP